MDKSPRNGSNLFLDLPPDILGQILAYNSVSYMSIRLWQTGSPALQSLLRRCVDSVSLTARKRSQMTSEHRIPYMARLPACLVQFARNRSFAITVPESRGLENLHLLLDLSPSLERLKMTLPNGLYTLKTSTGPHRSSDSIEGLEGSEHQAHRAHGTGDANEAVEAAHNRRSILSFFGSSSDSKSDLFPSAEAIELDIASKFPKLLSLELRSCSISASPISLDPDTIFPAGLTELECAIPEDSLGLERFASQLPRSLTELRSLDLAMDLPASFYAALPSLTTLEPRVYEVSLKALEVLPRSLTRLGFPFSNWNSKVAHALPPGITRLVFDFSDTPSRELKYVPPSVTYLKIFTESGSSLPVRSLPRQLTSLVTNVGHQNLSPGDFPPLLTDLRLNIDSVVDVALVAMLPRCLKTLEFNCNTPPDALFFSQLPQGLTHLELTRFGDIESDKPLSLPSGLRKAVFTGFSEFEELSASGKHHLRDLDAWTKQDTLDVDQGLTKPPHPSEGLLRPFPYHILPQGLTEFKFESRPTPVSALKFFPSLILLHLKELVLDARFDPSNPMLLARANELRLFGKTNKIRAELASKPLTQAGILDLLPLSLVQLSVLRPLNLPPIDSAEWQRFSSLEYLCLGDKVSNPSTPFDLFHKVN